MKITYPATATVAQTDTLHGTVVADPYRWLENDVRGDPAVKAWVDAENVVTDAYLATLPRRAAIAARLTELWDFEKFETPVKSGGRYFYRRNAGLQNQFVLFVEDGAETRVLIDPNGWSADGATALAEWSPSHDGTLLSYAVQDGGSDWRTVRILDVATGETLADELKWLKFSGGTSWAKDGSGFWYSRFPEPDVGAEFQAPNTGMAVYFHTLGDPQSADRLVFARPDRPSLGHYAQVTDDGRWLVITTYEGTDDKYEINVLDLAQPGAEPRALFAGLENSWKLAGSAGERLFFVTDRDAPRYRLVAIDATGGALTEIVAESAATLESATRVGDRLVLLGLQDARSVVASYALDGSDARGVELPGIGTAMGFDGEAGDPETFYLFTSFNAPTTIYRYDSATGLSTVFKAPVTPFDPSQYEVAQEFFASKDGTRVPMFVVRRRGLPTPAPTLLYGYGGFNISVTPAFSVSRLAWLEMGGGLAVANIRGGGEYGKAWHDGGRRLEKQNVFDDFIAAAEHLIATGVTTPAQLAIQGGSNGGLLVGAAVNQRPELFAAGLPAVGVMDMLRYDQFTAGRYWIDDYGDPADPEQFANLLGYSPYHNVRKGVDYPAILVTTADTDDRVVPGHSFKYAARLQASDIGDKPHLIRIETRAGHGSGKPTDKIIAEYADLWAFAAHWTGLVSPAEAR